MYIYIACFYLLMGYCYGAGLCARTAASHAGKSQFNALLRRVCFEVLTSTDSISSGKEIVRLHSFLVVYALSRRIVMGKRQDHK